MNPCRIFIERPVATTLLTVALLIAGIIGYVKLPVADLPNVDFPVIQVQAQQAGGSPEEIASSVAAPLEKHLGQIADLTEMTSQSTQNQVRITLQFSLSRDINGAARDVEAALQASHADLPSSLRQNPSYFKANPNGAPIIILALTSPTRTPAALYDLASNVLQQHLSQIRGVGMVDIAGSALPAVRVEMNPLKLFRYGIGFEDVRAALSSANAHGPKGIIDQDGMRFTLDTNDQARSAQAYRDLIIAYRSTRPVRLSDIAEVHDGVEDIRNAGFFNRQRAVIAVVFPQAGANVIHTIDQIKAEMPVLQTALPADVALHTALDRSLTIRASLEDTQSTLIIGVILVVLVTLVFLRSIRMTIIPAIVVPTSIIATFGVMELLNFSLDNMSLMALTVSTGFVVDDAIVVLENIARYIEEGLPPREAALRGAQEVAFTVLSISISLIAVFLPILLLGGLAGRLFHELAMTVSITIMISMLLSLSLTPMLASRILKPASAHAESAVSKGSWFQRLAGSAGRISGRLVDGMAQGYEASLDVALRHNRLVLLTLPLTLIVMGVLFVAMPKGFFPTEDTGMLMGHLQGDQSSSFTAMKQKADAVQVAVMKEKEVESIAGSVGGGRGSSNQANLFLQLKDKSQRGPAENLMVRITNRLSNLVGAKFYLMQPGAVRAGARQGNAGYQYTLEGDTASELYSWAPKLVAALSRHPEILDVSSDVQQGGSAIVAAIDRDTSSRVQITPQLISNTVYDAFGQRAASIIYNTLNQYRVVMEAAPEFSATPDTINQVWVSSSGGSAGGGTVSNTIRVTTSDADAGSTASETASVSSENFRNQIQNQLAGGSSTSTGSAVSTGSETMIPITFITDIYPSRTPLAVNHQGQSVAATISFNMARGAALSRVVEIIQNETVKLHMPSTVHGSFAGNAAQFQQSVNDEPLLILAALVAVYVVLGILYESYVHPLTILSTLPSAGVGALLALELFGEDFSLIAMIGVILLIGIVKKNAIMLVDFAIHAERETNCSPLEAIRTACLLRFRPIIMTSLAAALGAAPLVFGNGYGAEMRRPLGIAIVGGLLVSQALTLYTTPVVYLTLDRLALRIRRRSWKIHPHHTNPREA
ncbi:efflux RND transporter permease subunit [Acetobacter oeni]|uniref:Transport system membrane protein n=1 Tax=Acetobacter oeni TaxID=304077 RepID=A0A511XMX5_9PROT|nr:efflux RND transporter permease subunit [Acetobacter oeni]MBB3881507.1 multidrug efflux pump [Acetobacter oeni]NHO18371.1 MMPL family transporter [Acetobacter oeni]GBR10792.1 multidrug efflux pump acriflavin resistance protein AcrB/AcrD/AcrF [Acetobacter oeni LMG 21952]GEN64294.1 transport system membrane protein [Acetobacter oeni]